MAIAAFKDLCLDAADPEVVGRFWSAAFGLPLEKRDDGDAAVHGPPLDHLWIDRVPEPKVVKNRVHLDVHADAGALVELGATLLADHGRWQVLADPEGNELCAFPDPDPPAAGEAPARPFAVCVDSADPMALADWWADVLGGTRGDAGNPRWIHGGAGLGSLVFKCVPVTDPRVAKNRCHWDVTADDVDRLVAAGATVLRARDDEIAWTVMADPQGNEFCAFTSG
jgi:glyoxalase superfamily protein